MAVLQLLVQFGELLLGLDVLVEVENLASQIRHHFNLALKYLVELLHVVFHIGAWLVHILENTHFFLDYLDRSLAALVVLEYKLLLFFKDLLNEFLMIVTEPIHIASVL